MATDLYLHVLDMATDPRLSRRFQHDSVDQYYKFKIRQFPPTDGNPDPILSSQKFESVEELCNHLHMVAKKMNVPLDTCTTWGEYIASLPKDAQKNAWKYREYVFATAMLFVGSYLSTSPTVVSFLTGVKRPIPTDFDITAHSFTIVGSSKLESDVDITIEGPRSSVLISVIEDLFQHMTDACGIPIRCWDVEFYGDFHILQSMFVNISKFKALNRLIMLKYALISYFRSTGQGASKTPVVHPSVAYLAKKFLQENGNESLYDSFLQQAYDAWRMEAPGGVLDRTRFYKQLGSVEDNSILLSKFVKQTNMGGAESNNGAFEATGTDVDNFAFDTFQAIMIANTHRAESYILPSTAVHVVEIEQKRVDSKGGLPESWFASNARIGIDRFGYILSAIEQLGYLEHYHPEDVACNKKGIKYFGRYVRALSKAGLLTTDSPFLRIGQQLNAYRSSEDPSVVCEQNVHTLLQNILATLTGIRGGGGGRRRTLRRARRRASTRRMRV
jgi:hypothetical protein